MKHLIPPEHAADPLRIELVAERGTLAPTMLRVPEDAPEAEVVMALSAAIVHRCSANPELRKQLAEVIVMTSEGDLELEEVEIWLEERCGATLEVLLDSGTKVAAAIRTLGLGEDACPT